MNMVSNTSKVMKGISSQALVTIVLGVVEIVSFSIMSRLLTKEDFGYFAAITAITTIFSTFSDTGVGSAIVQQKCLSKSYINNAFTLSLLFGGVISILLLAFSGPLSRAVADESMKTPLMLMSVTLLLNSLTSVNTSLMHRKLQFLRLGSINLFSLVITTCIAVWLAWKGYGYYAIITKAVLGSIITYFISLYFCKTHFSISLDKQSFKEILQITEYSNSLKKREEDLKQAQILSGQIVDITNHLKSEVNTQNEKLYEIDDNVLNVDKNVEKGLNELKQIEIITRASKKRLYCLIVLIIIVVAVILYYVIKMFKIYIVCLVFERIFV